MTDDEAGGVRAERSSEDEEAQTHLIATTRSELLLRRAAMLSIAATNILVHACAVLDGAACYTPLTRTASAGGKLSATPPFAALAKSRFNIESTSPWVMRRDALHTRPHFFGFDHLFSTHYGPRAGIDGE